MSKVYVYTLYDYEDKITIFGTKKLDIRREVEGIFSEMSNEELKQGLIDLFVIVALRICERHDFKMLNWDGYVDVRACFERELQRRSAPRM